MQVTAVWFNINCVTPTLRPNLNDHVQLVSEILILSQPLKMSDNVC